MKTTSKKRNNAIKNKKKMGSDIPEEEVAVIVDVRSGAEYYMFMIDEFSIGKNSYSVMVPYEPDRIRSKDTEVVILRSQIAKNGDRIFISLTDKKELNATFELFFNRFEEAGIN